MPEVETQYFEVELPEKKTGGCSFALLGSTRSGKTTLLKHIIKEYFDKHIKVLMSTSIHAPIYKEISDCIKSPIYSARVVKEGYEINRKCENHYDLLFILDDVVDKKFDKELVKLLAVYRNSNLSTIISLQSPMMLNTSVRSNINFIILMKLNSDEAIEKIIRMYLMSYLEGKMSEKVRLYKDLTENHFFFVINNLTGEVYRSKIVI